ncbi:hypothetical protein M1349_00915 [Patescibacteria group bacterium]|nr:hypothetical protein [Patescibacteria group bacterium]
MVETEERLFNPPTSAEPKKPTFIRTLHTPVELYHSIPRGSNGRGKHLMGKANPGLEVEIEGISWQQFCEKRNPKKNPSRWVLVKIVSPGSNYQGYQAFVTMGDITRLPEEMKQKNQPKQRQLTRRGLRPTSMIKDKSQLETEIALETDSHETFIQRIRTSGVRLFKEHPRPRMNDESEASREEYLKQIELGRTHGKIEITVQGSSKKVWGNRDDHYLEGAVTAVTSLDMDFYGIKKVFVSKGEAARKPKK